MVVYRRNFVAGGTYFFTVTLRDRRARFLVDYVDELHAAFAQSRARKPFVIEAMVVLPDHLHTIWRLPDHDTDYPGRWKSIKSLFTQSLARNGLDVGKRRDGSASIWQRRYWEHTIRDEQDWQHHIDYIHFNPVKHGWVHRARDWPFSSFHRYVRRGILPLDWAGDGIEDWSLKATDKLGCPHSPRSSD
ncbi:transposase [Methylomonas sp. SURF-1]|uniref:Transposase n=1 Tax=Methylomonas aurea TaxID=2952224 RepID=A0ABT1UDA6_9GAMM|nr:transposase [Methylomonas sp. SURF-1]MCQ8180209.1 transposase [Methylomonas sp. SURF-1]